ncbi:MAG: DUF262 domain-containing protein [Desulfobacteraceae bacterium]|nr:DUF262 domain-containing protein [Desulfobacteraceae bacterium]MBC2758017.1 DUF262 domain-containing protein [Desulfobacteraceae bacterium]
MKIEMHSIPIKDVVKDYKDSAEEGVTAYGGILDIRPKYQREFVYKDKQRDEVIETVKKQFPLNIMYWVKKPDGNFEVLDGQQRTISIAQFIVGEFSINEKYFHSLTKDEQEQILNYEMMIYFCEGKEREKLDWFRIVNIAGEKLTDQELRNAVFTGPWLSDAKLHFSKPNCAAHSLAGDKGQLMKGSPIRQELLETVLSWINNENIKEYMSKHQHDNNAEELWEYFQKVIEWVRDTFPNYRREMKGIDWGVLYNKFKDKKFDPEKLEDEISLLMEDEDVTNKKGIYSYVLNRKEKHLNIRAFSLNQKREAYERQKGICPVCKEHFEIEEMEADHITPWHEGGKTSAENCQMLCKEDNRRKSGK